MTPGSRTACATRRKTHLRRATPLQARAGAQLAARRAAAKALRQAMQGVALGSETQGAPMRAAWAAAAEARHARAPAWCRTGWPPRWQAQETRPATPPLRLLGVAPPLQPAQPRRARTRRPGAAGRAQARRRARAREARRGVAGGRFCRQVSVRTMWASSAHRRRAGARITTQDRSQGRQRCNAAAQHSGSARAARTTRLPTHITRLSRGCSAPRRSFAPQAGCARCDDGVAARSGPRRLRPLAAAAARAHSSRRHGLHVVFAPLRTRVARVRAPRVHCRISTARRGPPARAAALRAQRQAAHRCRAWRCVTFLVPRPVVPPVAGGARPTA